MGYAAVSEHLDQQSLLDWLRPETGFQTDVAIVSTYSASAGVLASLLLSLAGHEDDPADAGARATRVKFARSVTQLRGKVAIALQAGRLFCSRKSGKPIALLDRFIKEIPWDERVQGGKSWHPKCAIVRYSEEESPAGRWRFWLGSRNLTRDASWDLGLSLDGYEDEADVREGTHIPSIANVAAKLAASTGVSEKWKDPIKRLKNVYWDVPRGLVVEDIDLMLPDETGREFPDCPPGLRKLIAVAPFMDVTTSGKVARWGDGAQRVLVSTGQEMNRLAAERSGFFEKQGFGDVRAFSSVVDAGEQDVVDQSDGSAGDIETSQGLHAKFLWAEHTGGATIWLGSPNLTQRAWKRNAEIFACVGAASRSNALAELRDGVEKFADMAPAFSVSAANEQTDADEQIDFARTEVAARLMKAKQFLCEEWTRVEIAAPEAPHPSNPKFVLKVGPVADDPDQMAEWPRGSKNVELHPQHPNAASHLVRVGLECKGGPSITWLQSILIDDLPQDRRDNALLGEYLDDDHLFAWIYQTLTDNSEGAEGGPWDGEQPHSRVAWHGKRKNLAPTLEQLLRAWLKGRSSFEEIHKILAIRSAGAGSTFDSFKKSLDLIEQSLIGKQQP
jgi:hypothetical protein